MNGGADLLDRIPILGPGFGFTRHQKGEVRLVVGVNPRHEFNIRAALPVSTGFGEIAIPRIAELVVAQVHCFLPGEIWWLAIWTMPACAPWS